MIVSRRQAFLYRDKPGLCDSGLLLRFQIFDWARDALLLVVWSMLVSDGNC